MRRNLIRVVISLLTFTFGITASALLAGEQHPTENSTHRAELVAVPTNPTAPAAEVTPTPDLEIVFGGGRLKLLRDEVRLKSEGLRYHIDVTYPQIAGSDELHIRLLNERIKEMTAEHYQWPLTITDEDLRNYQVHPEAYNGVDIVYDVSLATDSVLSIYFADYTSAIGAAHGNQDSFVVNYDLVFRKELKLSDLFAPGSKYLQYISRYCTEEFKQAGYGQSLFPERLAPVSRNFKSWNVTSTGIRFNFDRCQVFGCSDGSQAVEIPFDDLKPILSARAMSILPISPVVKVNADH